MIFELLVSSSRSRLFMSATDGVCANATSAISDDRLAVKNTRLCIGTPWASLCQRRGHSTAGSDAPNTPSGARPEAPVLHNQRDKALWDLSVSNGTAACA